MAGSGRMWQSSTQPSAGPGDDEFGDRGLPEIVPGSGVFLDEADLELNVRGKNGDFWFLEASRCATLPEAIEAYENAIWQDPAHLGARVNRAVCFLRNGQRSLLFKKQEG